MNLLSHLFGGNAKSASRAGRRRPARLSIEVLEDRTVPASVSVVPLTATPNNSSTFGALEDAIKAAGNNGTVTVEPGATADFNIDITQSGLTIQGDPNVPSSILPSYNISIDANNVVLKNLNINFVSVNPGFNGLQLAKSTVGSVFISGGPTGNGNNTITQNAVSGDVTVIGNTDLGVPTNDNITYNTFSSFSQSVISVTSDNGATIKYNQITGGGSLSTDTNGNTITRAPQTGIEVDGGTGVVVANNTITVQGQNGPPGGTTGAFTGINIAPFNPAGAGLPANTPVAAPTVQVMTNTVNTGRGIGLAITAPKSGTGDRDTQVTVQGNDFHNNAIGVSYTGNGGSTITTDLGGGTLGSLGGNDFRGFTTSGSLTNAAIVLQGVGTGAVLTAHSNSFAPTVTPPKVVFAATGSIDVSQSLTTKQAFVQALFNNFLQRTGQISELNYWVGVFDASSTGQSDVVNGIAGSTESLSRLIDGYYIQYLGRQADANGEAYFVNLLQNGETLDQVQAGFISSQEFISSNNSDYIQGLYRTFFNRTGSSTELGYWYAQLPTLGLAGVAQQFAGSAENRTQFVTNTFKAYLHRPPTANDLSVWTSQTGSLNAIALGILNTPEFLNNG